MTLSAEPLKISVKRIGVVRRVLRKWCWVVPSEQSTPVVVVKVDTLEPVSDWPSAMAIVWNAFSFMSGNWAMISALATVTTPLASVVAALAEVAKAIGAGDRGGGHEAEDDLAHGVCLFLGVALVITRSVACDLIGTLSGSIEISNRYYSRL